ncbi:MAG: PadR family transcriptional regulator [Hyphomonadaceae bacterium]
MTLTNLEGAALGVLTRMGAATSYALAREFAASASEFWSGSAGAIYPLMRRLASRKLLRASAANTRGRRRATTYAITATGRAALRCWLMDAERASGLGFDPLRTRLIFDHLITPAERKQLLRQVLRRYEMLRSGVLDEADAYTAGLLSSWLDTRCSWIEGALAKPRSRPARIAHAKAPP